MLLVFFDCHGIVHHEFAPEGQTVKAAFYMEVLKRLKRSCASRIVGGEAMDSSPRQCTCAFCINRAWVFGMQFHHRARTSPYSPDLAPCDFFLFPKCKLVLRGRNLGDVTTIKSEMTSLLKGLREAEFQGCFQQWKQRWDKCIVSNGEYFEGDHIDVS